MKLYFLGTGSAVPTKDRGLTCIALKIEGETALIDCGDGSQRQLVKMGLGFKSIKRVFITHLHGDHFLGLPAIVQTFSMLKRDIPLEVYGPKGLKPLFDKLFEVAYFDPSFDLKIIEVESETSFRFSKYSVKFFRVHHGEVPCYGIRISEHDKPGKLNVKKADELGVPVNERWKLKRGMPVTSPSGRIVYPEEVLGPPKKGRVIVYSSDTRPCNSVVKNSRNADVLIHDSTFTEAHKERALATFHSTVREACLVAKQANVKTLVLTHFSARYNYEDIEKEVSKYKDIFSNVVIARDLMTLEVSPPT